MNYEDSVTNTSTTWLQENYAVVASCIILFQHEINTKWVFYPKQAAKALNNFLGKAKMLCDQRDLDEKN